MIDNYPDGMSEMDYRYVGELPAYLCKRCNRWLWSPCKNCKTTEDCFCDGYYKERLKEMEKEADEAAKIKTQIQPKQIQEVL